MASELFSSGSTEENIKMPGADSVADDRSAIDKSRDTDCTQSLKTSLFCSIGKTVAGTTRSRDKTGATKKELVLSNSGYILGAGIARIRGSSELRGNPYNYIYIFT